MSRHGDVFWKEQSHSFGARYLRSKGWTNGQGLGKSNQGACQCIRVPKKKDNGGVGATAVSGDEVLRGTQQVFNDVLKRLQNENTNDASASIIATAPAATASSAVRTCVAPNELNRRFRKGKDIHSYSVSDLDAILVRTSSSSAPASSSLQFCDLSTSSSSSSSAASSDLIFRTSKQSLNSYFSFSNSSNCGSSPSRSRFQVAGGSGFSTDVQQDIFSHLSSLNDSYAGHKGLGFVEVKEDSVSSAPLMPVSSSSTSISSSSASATSLPSRKNRKRNRSEIKSF